ncbi:MAG TPA: hypothetical protein VEH27_09465 [Methylomirabilota bacterium]|nr:hypothetical protein [Methylomirabilota bacterium]
MNAPYLPCPLRLLAVVALSFAATTQAARLKPASEFVVKPFIETQNISAFTWDSDASVWILREQSGAFVIERAAAAGQLQWVSSFQRRGNQGGGMLVHEQNIYVADGDAVRWFKVNDGKHLVEQTPWVTPGTLFPSSAHIGALTWAPAGGITFAYTAGRASGVGRVEPRSGRWDVIVKGLSGDFAYDLNGFPVASDLESDQLFIVRHGLDYADGLHNFSKSDLSLPTDKSQLKPRAIALQPGSGWAAEDRGTWLVADAATSTLQQFGEEGERLNQKRNLARWERGATPVDIQTGPDGAVWALMRDESGSASIERLGPAKLIEKEPSTINIPSLTLQDLADLLKGDNAWARDAAVRTLENREELRQARGLHPRTPLAPIVRDTNAPIHARVNALLAVHRAGLLDEFLVETASEEPEPALQIWGLLLFGERNYPTGVAFQRIMKLAGGTNSLNVRMAAAVACRMFVSSTLAVDTPPKAMPIREVFTGGLLSTLWFSTEKSHSAAFDLLYWNAVRPISAYDPGHPIGFFMDDFKEGVPIARWTLELLSQQVAEHTDPLRQEDGVRMMADLKPPRMILSALQGLKKGTPRQAVTPTETSLNVLRQFAKHENPGIAGLAQELVESWEHYPQRSAY